MSNLHQQQGSNVGFQYATIAYNLTGASAGIPIVKLPAGTIITSYNRYGAYTGGSSPNLAIGTTATGTEIVASGATSAAVMIILASDTTVYASLTGSPTGGTGSVGIGFVYPN